MQQSVTLALGATLLLPLGVFALVGVSGTPPRAFNCFMASLLR